MLRTALIGLGATSLGAGLYFYATRLRRTDFQNGVKLGLRCNCGQFHGHITVPKDESKKIGLNVVCHCKDCVKWATQVAKHGALTSDGGDELFMVPYGSISLDNPELARSVRLYPKTGTHRYLTTCCDTAVAVTLGPLPLVGLNGSVVEDKDRAALLAHLSPPFHSNLHGHKKEPKYANDPNAGSTASPRMVFQFLGLAARSAFGLNKSPLPEVSPNEQVMFKDGK